MAALQTCLVDRCLALIPHPSNQGTLPTLPALRNVKSTAPPTSFLSLVPNKKDSRSYPEPDGRSPFVRSQISLPSRGPWAPLNLLPSPTLFSSFQHMPCFPCHWFGEELQHVRAIP